MRIFKDLTMHIRMLKSILYPVADHCMIPQSANRCKDFFVSGAEKRGMYSSAVQRQQRRESVSNDEMYRMQQALL